MNFIIPIIIRPTTPRQHQLGKEVPSFGTQNMPKVIDKAKDEQKTIVWLGMMIATPLSKHQHWKEHDRGRQSR